MVILIVLAGLVIFTCVWSALVASGRANEKESETQVYNREDYEDEIN